MRRELPLSSSIPRSRAVVRSKYVAKPASLRGEFRPFVCRGASGGHSFRWHRRRSRHRMSACHGTRAREKEGEKDASSSSLSSLKTCGTRTWMRRCTPTSPFAARPRIRGKEKADKGGRKREGKGDDNREILENRGEGRVEEGNDLGRALTRSRQLTAKATAEGKKARSLAWLTASAKAPKGKGASFSPPPLYVASICPSAGIARPFILTQSFESLLARRTSAFTS